MLEDLGTAARMRLMEFVCSFAWADLEVNAEERAFVRELIGRLALDETERARVEGWLKSPPGPENIDPTQIPVADREAFLEAIHGVVEADGEIHQEEAESLAVFRQLLP
ncbi:MAG: TerB family tellurite resistance protein [Myxococcota bacterium]|nr:TerB family tellurite resistance protein [Myxococcota bacterium]